MATLKIRFKQFDRILSPQTIISHIHVGSPEQLSNETLIDCYRYTMLANAMLRYPILFESTQMKRNHAILIGQLGNETHIHSLVTELNHRGLSEEADGAYTINFDSIRKKQSAKQVNTERAVSCLQFCNLPS